MRALNPEIYRMKKTFLFLIFIHFQLFVSGNRYLSGEFSFDVLGKDSILVRLTLVRDCLGDVLTPVTINVFCAENEILLTHLKIDVPAGTDITYACPLMGGSRCENPKSVFPFGFEQFIFQKLLILPDTLNCCALRFNFQDCCRSLNLKTTSINQPFYTESTLNRCLMQETSISYANPSAFVYITHIELIYSQGIQITSKGLTIDSVRCRLATPKNSHNSSFIFDSPYTFSTPLFFRGFPDTSLDFPSGFHLSKEDGTLSFTGDTAQTTVLSVLYELFAQGKMLASLRREMYVAIMDYPINHLPELIYDTTYKEVKAGDSVIFHFQTFDSDTSNTVLISYSGSLPGAIWTSNSGQAKHPEAQLIWKTKREFINVIPYQFTVTVSDNHCPSHGIVSTDFYVLVNETGAMPDIPAMFTIEKSEDKIVIHFNPSSQKDYTLLITDLCGKLLYYNNSCRHSESIDLSKLPSGIYFLRINSNYMLKEKKVYKFFRK